MKDIIIKGARQHNLKNINVTIRRDRPVITGVPCSGKPALAARPTLSAKTPAPVLPDEFLGLMPPM